MQDFIKKNAKKILFTACFAVAGIFYVLQNSTNLVKNNNAGVVIDYSLPAVQESSEIQQVFVYVCGQVKYPGVYELPYGSRMVDAINSAGGITEHAFVENINLAELIRDGQRIYVPDVDGSEGFDDARININTAGKSELMTLPGIGQSKAEDIIAYRNSNGAFDRIEDIMGVPGIKESAFLKIKDYIKVT